MHIFSAIILIGSASAVAATSKGQRSSLMALSGIFERQVEICKPVPAPATCEKSCGPGNVQCISFPNCYNPSKGESCCSNGKYCQAGYYCTDAGCCPNGRSLAECNAKITLSVIPPPVESTIAATPESTSSSAAIISSTTTEATKTSVAYSTTKTPIYTLPSALSTAVGTVQSNFSATASLPGQATGGAGQNLGHDYVGIALGGLSLLLILL